MIPVVTAGHLRLAQADRHSSRPPEVHDSLATLADDLAFAYVAQRPEQLAVEAEAPLEIGDDEIEVIDARSAH